MAAFIRRLLFNFLTLFLVVDSEEVVGGSQTDVGDFRLARGWVECQAKQSEQIRKIFQQYDLQIVFHELVNFHYRGFISASVAVVGC